MHDETTDGGVFWNGNKSVETTTDFRTTEINTELRFVYTRDLYVAVGYALAMNSDRTRTTTNNSVVLQNDKLDDDDRIHTGAFTVVAKF